MSDELLPEIYLPKRATMRSPTINLHGVAVDNTKIFDKLVATMTDELPPDHPTHQGANTMTKITVERETLEAALDALDNAAPTFYGTGTALRDASTTLRAALAAQPAEPVAVVKSKHGDPERFGEREIRALVDLHKIPYNTNLYAAQPAPAAVPPDERTIEAVARVICEWTNQNPDQPLEFKDGAYTHFVWMRETRFARAVLAAAAGEKP